MPDVYKRQSLYYERSGHSKNKEALSALVQQQVTLLQPKDVINTHQLTLLKDMGCDAIRTSHNMPTPELVAT